jgi:D-3-phosphoglycerate dehydrogenase
MQHNLPPPSAGETHVFVTIADFAASAPDALRLLEQSGLTVARNTSGKRMTPEQVAVQASSAIGVIAGTERYDAATFDALADLRCISRVGVGTDSIDLAEAARRGIRVLTTADEPTQAVAELTLGLMLGLLRAIPRGDRAARAGRWERFTGRLLEGKTVGVIGTGRIGRRVAKLVSAFGAHAIGTHTTAPAAELSAQGIEPVALDELLARADIVSLHASVSVEHPLRLGAAELRSMKRGAYLINVARGQLVDDVALARALDSGHLAGAALDVFAEEPYKGPLLANEHVILSPHVGTLAVETRQAMELRAVQNLLEFLTSPRPRGTG